jgi:hypothetical protein
MPRPINRANDMNLLKLIERYDTDDKCRITLEKLRWPTGALYPVPVRKGLPG